MSRTPFAETEALLAVMEQDEAEARRILEDSTATELAVFADQVAYLADLIDQVYRPKVRAELRGAQ